MSPNPIVLQIVTPFARGTATLIDHDLVVTAGHVIQPHTPTPTPTALIQIIAPDGTVMRPISALCHQRWSHGYAPSADMAVLRLGAPRPDLVSPSVLDVAADQLDVSVGGFDASGVVVTTTGSVARSAHPDGYDVLISSDLRFPSGVSGAPIFDAAAIAIGIATWSPTQATANSFIGIPFLSLTLGWLRMNCH